MFTTFPSTNHLIAAIVVALLNAVALCSVSLRLVHMFQLGGYRTRNFVKWITDMRVVFFTRLLALSILSFGSMLIVSVMFYHFTQYFFLSYLGLTLYMWLLIVFCVNISRTKTKVPFVCTARVKRLFVVLFLISFELSIIALWIGSRIWDGFWGPSGIAVIIVLLPALVIISNILLLPVEAIIKNHYIKKAKRKITRHTNLIRIGITGSYGKTSCKDILASMLEKKFKVAKSPASFNTPMGFAKTVNDVLDCSHEILIFEMGLRYKRDIRYLAKLFKPEHGILTSIGTQHIETMKTIDAIKAEKSELVKAVTGIAVLNGESKKCVEVYNELKKDKWILTNLNEVTNTKITPDGCSFKVFDMECTTQLLGKHNIENILMCVALARELGVDLEDIKAAISELKPTPHRLELVKAPSGIIVLDDSYNGSEHGIRAALDVIDLFEGKKVVQTPGIIEQGSRSAEANFKLGRRIAKSADQVIIVNQLNQTALMDGLRSKDFSADKIHFAKNLTAAKTLYSKLLKPGDVLLIANDLPDNFN